MVPDAAERVRPVVAIFQGVPEPVSVSVPVSRLIVLATEPVEVNVPVISV